VEEYDYEANYVYDTGSRLVLLLNCAQVRAQATAQISGRVQDATAAVLPGVEITATNTAMGIARTTVTNESERMFFRICRSAHIGLKRRCLDFGHMPRTESCWKSTASRH